MSLLTSKLFHLNNEIFDASAKLAILNSEETTSFKAYHVRNEEDVILFRILVKVLINGADNIEDLAFAITRGYFPILVNTHIIKSPLPFYELVRKRKKLIKDLYDNDYAGWGKREESEDEANLKRVKRAYRKTFKQRQRCICTLINTLSHQVCADVSRFTAHFVGVY